MEFRLWHYFAIFHLIWGVIISRWLYRLLHGGLDHLLKEDPEYVKQFEPFRRKDIRNWNLYEIYFCAIFLLPYRFAANMILLVILGVLCKALTFGVDLNKEMSLWRRLMIRGVTAGLTRLMLYCCGVYHIERKYHKITDFDPTYPKELLKRKERAPIVVSNHISFLDVFYFAVCRHNPCFMAKREIADWPIIGWIVRCKQGVFVKREDRTNKDAVLAGIKERVRQVQSGQHYPPMVIFPEGTTTNGSAVMTFKRGAFASLAPVRVMCLEYPRKDFNPAYDNMNLMVTFVLMLSHFYMRIRVHDMGVYYPDHLNLKEESDWEIYASKVQQIVAKCLNVPVNPMSLRERMEYYYYTEGLKEKFKKERSKKKNELAENAAKTKRE